MSNITVFYHENCADGLLAAAAISEAMPAGAADLIAVQYGDITEENYRPQWQQYVEGRTVYIVDFSVKPAIFDEMLADARFVHWVDHHKTAFEDYGLDIEKRYWQERIRRSDLNHAVYLWNAMSGAELAWLTANLPHLPFELTPDELRENHLPDSICFVGDRDLWRWQYPDTGDFVAGLFGVPELFDIQTWRHSLRDRVLIDRAIEAGSILNRAHKAEVHKLLEGMTFVQIDGEQGLACNAPHKYASDLGHDMAVRSGTFGLTWRLVNGEVHCSLRSQGEYDVSAIAKAHGGGGHRNAAGFSCDLSQLVRMIEPNHDG